MINGNSDNVIGWPIGPLAGAIEDIAVGNLDGIGGLDVAAISDSVAALYVNDHQGVELWQNTSVSGRSVEIGNVNNGPENEVVVGDYGCNAVYVYDGNSGELKYSFNTVKPPTEVELGNLNRDTKDLEIAVITGFEFDATIYAIDINISNQVNEMWSYIIDWTPHYHGEGLAIGDVDRDYKNKVIAGSNKFCNEIYAFDGLDNDGDGKGDIVWKISLDEKESVNDLEVGDIDGDSDMDVVVGSDHGGVECVYALGTEEHTVDFAGDTIFSTRIPQT